MTIIYSDGFHLNFGNHIFPSIKYRMTKERLVTQSWCSESDFVEPERARDQDILLVHTPEYVNKLKTGNLSIEEILRLEVPYSRELVDAVWLTVGGTIEACRRAIADGIGITLSGGFHHAFAGHGEGFCLLNDVAVGIRTLQNAGAIRTAMTVDCDVHHGNGTADIFRNDPNVFTFSIHQANNYPFIKPPSDLDIHLDDGTKDEEYLSELAHGLDRALTQFDPDLIVYLAGGDPYRYDQLGGLALSLEGLMQRDRMVLQTAKQKKIPVTVTLAGGYAFRLEDTIEIHVNTVRIAREILSPTQDPGG